MLSLEGFSFLHKKLLFFGNTLYSIIQGSRPNNCYKMTFFHWGKEEQFNDSLKHRYVLILSMLWIPIRNMSRTSVLLWCNCKYLNHQYFLSWLSTYKINRICLRMGSLEPNLSQKEVLKPPPSNLGRVSQHYFWGLRSQTLA